MLGRPAIFGLDFGDRKGVWQLLQRLAPEQRMAWLRWCCGQAKQLGPNRVAAVGEGVLGEVYECWKSLCHSFGLDVDASVAELDRRVQQQGTPLLFAAGGVPSLPSSP